MAFATSVQCWSNVWTRVVRWRWRWRLENWMTSPSEMYQVSVGWGHLVRVETPQPPIVRPRQLAPLWWSPGRCLVLVCWTIHRHNRGGHHFFSPCHCHSATRFQFLKWLSYILEYNKRGRPGLDRTASQHEHDHHHTSPDPTLCCFGAEPRRLDTHLHGNDGQMHVNN